MPPGLLQCLEHTNYEETITNPLTSTSFIIFVHHFFLSFYSKTPPRKTLRDAFRKKDFEYHRPPAKKVGHTSKTILLKMSREISTSARMGLRAAWRPPWPVPRRWEATTNALPTPRQRRRGSDAAQSPARARVVARAAVRRSSVFLARQRASMHSR